MTKTKLSIIIVTFNSEKYIGKCIKSLLSSIPNNIIFKIIVIDNNSQDNTVKKIKRFQTKYKVIKLLINDTNRGFSGGTNQGIKNAKKSDFYLILNPDTISNSGSIVKLVNCAKKNNAGIIGGSTFDNVTENGSYFRFPNLRVGIFDFTNFRKIDIFDKWHKYFYYLDQKNQSKNCFRVDVVTGGYMLISSKTIENIGYFDEDFFMYLEDVDYCLRAKKAKIPVYHNNSASIIHFGGRSSNNKDRINHLSWIFSRKKYFIKHFSKLENLIIQPIFLIDDAYILISKYLKS